jgi:predicted regulator of Ras-like GTPase activity (Roadblock/LC7/MglB family)
LSWFHDITRNPHIEVALLVDSTGRLVATSNRIGSEAARVAAMIKAAEVLARGLSAELGRGEMRTLQLSTATSHMLVTPIGAAHYLIVLTTKDAPLELIFVYMQRLIEKLDEDDIALALQKKPRSPLDDIDTEELIEAVTEWLHNGGDSRRI